MQQEDSWYFGYLTRLNPEVFATNRCSVWLGSTPPTNNSGTWRFIGISLPKMSQFWWWLFLGIDPMAKTTHSLQLGSCHVATYPKISRATPWPAVLSGKNPVIFRTSLIHGPFFETGNGVVCVFSDVSGWLKMIENSENSRCWSWPTFKTMIFGTGSVTAQFNMVTLLFFQNIIIKFHIIIDVIIIFFK